MSTDEIFAIGRVVERIMISAFGGLSLTYGWNLFRVGVLSEQSAAFLTQGWRINLKRVGPGAFFALFGCAVLAVSIRSPLSLPAGVTTGPSAIGDTTQPAAATLEKSPAKIIYAEGDDPTTAKKWVASLNTILNVATPDKFPSSTQQKVVARTDVDLESLRNALVMRQFGAPLFGEYIEYQKKVQKYNTPGTPEQIKKFAQIDEWMESNRIQE